MPQPLAPVLHLFDCRAAHVFRDDQTSVRRDHEALGADQAVGRVACVLVQEHQRRYELPDQAQRGIDIELQPAVLGDAQDLGQARAFDAVRHQRQGR